MIRRSKLMFLNNKDDEKTKLVYERLNLIEKHFGELCSAFGAFTRKLGRYRDKHDDLAKALKIYSDEETIYRSFSDGLLKLSKSVTYIADFMHIHVQRMEYKVINELAQYDSLCRSARDILKETLNHREKELMRQKQLMDIKTKFVANSSSADSEIAKVNLEICRTNKEINGTIENFERQRLKDIKSVLLDFIGIQLKQLTKSIEVLSVAYQDISDINIDEDIESLELALGPEKSNTPQHEGTPRVKSQSMQNIGIPHSSLNSEILARFSKSTKNLHGETEQDSIRTVTPRKPQSKQDDEDEETNDEEDSSEESEEDSSSNDEKPEVVMVEGIKSTDKQNKIPKINDVCFKMPLKIYREGYVILKNNEEPESSTSCHVPKSRQLVVRSINGVMVTKKNQKNFKNFKFF